MECQGLVITAWGLSGDHGPAFGVDGLPLVGVVFFPSSFLVGVVLFFSGNRVLAFSGLSRLLGALYLFGELLQLFQQALVGDTERLHLDRVDLYSF